MRICAIKRFCVIKRFSSGTPRPKDTSRLELAAICGLTRVFQYLFADGNKVYFCTSNEKPVYKQLKAHPYVSFCTYPADFNPVLSVNGQAVFVDDMALKTRALDENPGIRSIYGNAGNPVFEIFYIEVEEVETFSFGEGPKTYTL